MSLFRIVFYFLTCLTSAFVPDTPLQLLPMSSSSNNNTTNQTLSTPPNPKPRPKPPQLINYVCNSRAFGSDLNRSSCDEAIKLVPRDNTPSVFGLRGTIPSRLKPYDVVLPHRWMSPDGWCAIEPVLEPGLNDATASAEDIAVASFVVAKHCVGRTRGWGGSRGTLVS